MEGHEMIEDALPGWKPAGDKVWKTEVSNDYSLGSFEEECQCRDGWELVAAWHKEAGLAEQYVAVWKRLA
jgi:hypothetical protein